MTYHRANLGHLVRPPATRRPWTPPRSPGADLARLRANPPRTPWPNADPMLIMPDLATLHRVRDALKKL